MKILVTGGAGFIGSNLVNHLLGQGHQVTVLDNLLSGYEQNLKPFPTVEFIRGDVRESDLVQRAAQGASVIFHMAAAVGNKRSIDNPILDAEINVLGTRNVLQAARAAGCKKVVYSSSAGIFGELKTLPITEDHPQDPDSPYGVSKLCAEKDCIAFTKLYRIPTVCLRYFNVFGPNQRFDAYGNVIPIFVFKMLRGEPVDVFGDGEQTRDFVYVDDVVQANYKAAMATELAGVFNVGSGTRISINGLLRELAEASGLEPDLRSGPPRPGDVRDSLADISRARQAFGFEPSVALKQGLVEYLRWARQEVAQRAAST